MALAFKKTHKLMEQNGDPRNKSCIYGQLFYDREAKNIQWKKDSYFNK